MRVSPFDKADDYRAAGWPGTIRLPRRKKNPPPSGFTGYDGVLPTDDKVATWQRQGGNIALRLPESVIGIDVDDYDDKHGGKVMAEAETELGELPATWRSSSRDDDLVSGIRFYRVPEGRRWADVVGDNVEVIHHGHRFAVVAPSIHPEGREYGWYDPDGFPADCVPTVEELPELPAAWVAKLDRGDVVDRDFKAQEVDRTEVDAWMGDLPNETLDPAVESVLTSAEESLVRAASRHDATRGFILDLVRKGEQGYKGVPTALDTLESMFSSAVGAERDAEGEWSRLLVGAYAIVKASPTPTAAELFDDLFDSTDILDAVKQAARAQAVGPEALLAVVLGRVLAELPPSVALPATIGGPASLNLGVALVGKSGGGKTALLSVSRRVLGSRGLAQKDIERNVGSGEGFAETFLYDEVRVGARGGKAKTGRKLLVPDPRRVLVADEVGQMDAIGARSGATLGPTLRSALTGAALGQENGTAERRRHVPEGAYRLVVLMGVQPTRSAALLRDADAGTPQRFVWTPVGDPDAPDTPVEWPSLFDEDWEWAPPAKLGDVIDYPEHIKAEVRAVRLNRLRNEEADDRDGHKLLTRLKVAAALAVLHGECSITDQWWELAGTIVNRSMRVQAECAKVLSVEQQASHNSVAIAKDRAEDAAADDRVKRAAQAILRKVREGGGEWVTWRSVRPAARLREFSDDALEALESSGQVEVQTYTTEKKIEARRLRYIGG
jgi:hypothetical protein